MNKLLIISERGPTFWGTHQINKESQFATICEDNQAIPMPEGSQGLLKELQGKRVLVYIHGLRTQEADVLESFSHIKTNLLDIAIKPTLYERFKAFIKHYLGYTDAYNIYKPYDVIIGYSWPSFNHESYYYKAKGHASSLSSKLAKHLESITKSASKVDVIAHSMGNYLLFEALKLAPANLKIDHIFSIAAAVPFDSLHSKGEYSKVLDSCKHLFVFHSKHDFALGWPFYLAEGSKRALGLLGPHKIECLKLKSVDTSAHVKGHSDYFASRLFYQYLSKIYNQELDLDTSSHFTIQS